MQRMAFWIGVASGDHVARGRAGGFMQLGHGKAAPLHRLAPGDGVIYYSRSAGYRVRDGLQSFTAMGVVAPGAPYPGAMGGGSQPFRRDVIWADTAVAPIRPLLAHLRFTAGRVNWGVAFRFGLLRVSAADFGVIAAAMQAIRPAPLHIGGEQADMWAML